MRVSIHLSALRKTKWYESIVRFVFGGGNHCSYRACRQEIRPRLGRSFSGVSGNLSRQCNANRKTRARKKEEGGNCESYSRKASRRTVGDILVCGWIHQ